MFYRSLGQDDSGGEVFGPPAPTAPPSDLLSPGGGFWSEAGSAITAVAKAVAPIVPIATKVYLQSKGKALPPGVATTFPAGGTPGLAPTTMMPGVRYGGSTSGGIPTWAYFVGGAAVLLGFGFMMSRR